MRIAAAVTATLFTALATGGVNAETAQKGKKPRLGLRVAPRVAFSPVSVLLTAELHGGVEADEYYCPALEWDWDDGSRSVRESDCAPLEEGGDLQRRYTAQHSYRRAGEYNVKVTLRHSTRTVAVANATVSVRPGVGDFSAQP